jgi:hypothetical protein
MSVRFRARLKLPRHFAALGILITVFSSMAVFAPITTDLAYGASAQSAPTEHAIDIMLESNVPFAASACHSSSGSAVNFGEDGAGHCIGNYYSISPFSVPPFMGPIGQVGGVISWTPGVDGRLDITLSSSFGGPPATNGSLTGWISSRSSDAFHVTSGDVPVWKAQGPITTTSSLHFDAESLGGIAKHDYLFRIKGSISYAEEAPAASNWHHIVADVDLGPNCPSWALSDFDCTPFQGPQFKNGNTPGLIGSLDVTWRQVDGQIVTTFKASDGGDMLQGKTPSRNSDRFVLTAWQLPSLKAAGPIGQGGDAAPGTRGGPFKIDAENPTFGNNFINISGWMFYSSHVPSMWPPEER